MRGKPARPVREGAVGKGPEPRAPRRRPTSLGERSGETGRWQHRNRAPDRLNSIQFDPSTALARTNIARAAG